jgi:hypothetical protein
LRIEADFFCKINRAKFEDCIKALEARGGNLELTRSYKYTNDFSLGSGTGKSPDNSSLFLMLSNRSDDTYALVFGTDAVSGDISPQTLIPDMWYNITTTRDILGEYKLYIDDVMIFANIRADPLNINNRFSIGKTVATSTSLNFQIGQVGTVNMFERV